MNSVEKLLEISSESLSEEPLTAGLSLPDWQENQLFKEIEAVLQGKNGFVAFESALVFFPLNTVGEIIGLREWNVPEGWKRYYKDVLQKDILFFAADLFAGQFGIVGKSIVRFEPETGIITSHSNSLGDWADKILKKYNYETGWSLAHEWQKSHGPLPLGYRLLGKRPFVLGGDYSVDNLFLAPSGKAMEQLGALYQQIRSAPDGSQVTITGWGPN